MTEWPLRAVDVCLIRVETVVCCQLRNSVLRFVCSCLAIAIAPLAEEKTLHFGARPDMSALLKQISQWFCSHHFSRPYGGAHGQDYQVCLDCGAVCGYDVEKMRRTGRLDLYTGAMSRPQ
jgi:hypothetical protein